MWVYDGAADNKGCVSSSAGWLQGVVRHSALVRYLLGEPASDRLIASRLIAASPIVAPPRPNPIDPRLPPRQIIAAFFRDLPAWAIAAGKAFVMDGAHYRDRPWTTAQPAAWASVMCSGDGYEAVDLQPLSWLTRHDATTFESPAIRTGEGLHAVAAEGVMSSRLIADLLAHRAERARSGGTWSSGKDRALEPDVEQR